MSTFITLSCPSCGGKLQITSDIDRFACGFCGHEHIVKRGRGIVTLAPVVEGLRNVQTGVDKTAAELAIVRLREEISQMQVNIDELRRKSPNEFLEPTAIEAQMSSLSLVVGFILLILWIETGISSLWTLLSIAILLAGGLYWMILSGRRFASAQKIQSKQVQELHATISHKQQLLSNHRQLVDQAI